MILDGMILAAILGFFRGGSLRSFEKLEIRGGKWILLLFVIQLAAFLLAIKVPALRDTAPFWVMSFNAIFIVIGLINRHVAGFNILLIGVILNVIVMITNGGKMPVNLDAAMLVDPALVDLIKSDAVKHTIMTSDTLFWFLGDIIPLVPPYPTNKVISIGDVFINVGGFVFIWKTMMLNNKNVETKLQSGEIINSSLKQ